MAKYWRMLPVSGFSDCSWAGCDVDKGWLVASRNMLERANLLLEGYFQALYVPLGGSKTRMESTPSKSMKFYISMFSDKPPCMPLCFSIVERRCNHIARGGLGFFIFLSLYSWSFFYIFFFSLSSTFSSFLAFFFHFLFFLRLFIQLFLSF